MKLYRAFATVGGLTMASRLLGFVRDIMIATVLGTGWVADAFFVAFRFPNLFRRLFGEGAFNSAFVPLFTKQLETAGAPAARQFAGEAASVLSTALLVFTAVAMLAMPLLMYAIAPGFADTPEKFDLAVLLTQICFPYLACMSLVALLSGVLNALGRFAVAAAAPILLNIVLISAMALAAWLGFGNSREAGILLATGVAIAGALQLVWLGTSVYRNGMGFGASKPALTPGVRRLVKLGIPGVIAGGITQVNILIGTIIASLQDGAVSYLQYADRLYQLPLGLVGVAIGVVLLPDISRHLRAGNHEAVADSQNRSLEFALLLTIPAAVALALVPVPILRVLFEHGAFTTQATQATAYALAGFATGLPAFVMIKVFSPMFFAQEDTKTPMYFAGVSVVVNVVLSVGLFFAFREAGFYPHVGIAIATSVAGWVNAFLLWWKLSQRGDFVSDVRLRRAVPRIVVSCIITGAVMLIVAALFAEWFDPRAGLLVQITGLLVLVASAVFTYGVAILASGALTPRQIRSMVRKG